MKSGEITQTNFQYKSGNLRKTKLAILKSAYLYAFYELGYAFIYNPNSMKIRDQLISLNEIILDLEDLHIKPVLVDDEHLGINILTYPKEFASYLIVLDYKITDYRERIGVFLPGTHDNGFKKLREFENLGKKKKIPKIEFNNINGTIELTDKNYLEPFNYWIRNFEIA